MAYKIVSQARAWWPIRFNGVTEDGEIVVNEIEGRFKILDEDDFVEFNEDIAEVSAALSSATDKAERRKLSALISPFYLRILEDWRGVTEDDGNGGASSVPFGKESLERMLRVPNFARGVTTANHEVRTAEPETRKGN